MPVTSELEAQTVVRESAYRGNHTVADRQCHQPLRVAALRIPAELPVVQHQIALWQTVHLPRFHTAPIPVDLPVAERDEPKGQIVGGEPLGVHTEGHDRCRQITLGQNVHPAIEAVLNLFGEAGPVPRSL